MTVRNSFKLLAVCFFLHSASAWSLGLGDARVESFIGQPLELRIELLTSPNDDVASVTARLASPEDFALIGASREAVSVPLNFLVREGRAGSGAYILVTSRLALNDPVLRLVIEVNWSSGRLLREYTVFLDPPTIPSQAPAPETSASRSTPPEPVAETAPVTAAPAPSQATPEVAESAPPPPVSEPEPDPGERGGETGNDQIQAVSGEAYGPVRSGETLWRIASSYIGQSNMNMNKVMLAIQRRNPGAFLNDNINLLKRGATLEMPTESEVEEISAARARELVAQQEAAFRMRSSLASSSTPLLAAESRPEAATTAPTAAAPAEPVAEEALASRLEIVPASQTDLSAGEPGTGAVPGGEGSEEVQRDLREELARTEEELISERQQNQYLRERISELESQLGGAEGATEGLLEDEALANLQDRLQSERLAEAGSAEAVPAEEEGEAPAPTNIPSVTTSAAADEGRPWYSGPATWFIMIVVLLAAVIGWFMNRRRGAVEYDLEAGEPISAAAELKGEAEEILRTLDSDRDVDEGPRTFVRERVLEEEAARAAADRVVEDDEDETVGRDFEPDIEPRIEDEATVERETPVISLERSRRERQADRDATVLDENSRDPEIKLDLARAYISMGDKEAARAILDEVLSIGNDEQQSEAREMLDEL